MTEGSWVEIGGGYSIGGGGGGFIRTDLLSVCTRIVRTHLLAPTTTVPATGNLPASPSDSPTPPTSTTSTLLHTGNATLSLNHHSTLHLSWGTALFFEWQVIAMEFQTWMTKMYVEKDLNTYFSSFVDVQSNVEKDCNLQNTALRWYKLLGCTLQ